MQRVATSDPLPISEPSQQPLDVVELQHRAGLLSGAAAKFFQDFAGALDVDLVRHFDRSARVGSFGALRSSHRIERDIRGTPILAGHLSQHLLGHRLGTLTKLLKRALLSPRCAIEVAVAKRLLGLFHGLLGTAELRRRLHAELLHSLAELSEAIT